MENNPHLGLGVMIGLLGGNEESVKAFKPAIGKEISCIDIYGEHLRIKFTDGTAIGLYDAGQSCCENRYMTTDDDLNAFVGGKLIGAETKPGPKETSQYGEDHDIEFLDVHTSRGTFQIRNHNEHNGYYGGFLVRCIKL